MSISMEGRPREPWYTSSLTMGARKSDMKSISFMRVPPSLEAMVNVEPP
jgi:hypothetical protein